MGRTIRYLNTDLDLTSVNDLTLLAAALEAEGVSPLHVAKADDGLWYSIIETDRQYSEPEPNIAAMLAVVEQLPSPLRTIWDHCSRREFNIGYDCGAEPWAFNQGISAALMGRMAAAGASLRWTLYPDRDQEQANWTPRGE